MRAYWGESEAKDSRRFGGLTRSCSRLNGEGSSQEYGVPYPILVRNPAQEVKEGRGEAESLIGDVSGVSPYRLLFGV
jgi:hypothetical protein